MAWVPFSYNVRSLWVRSSTTILTAVSIGATVAVVAGVLALEQGFSTLFSEAGRKDVAVFLRPGATTEGESMFTRDRGAILIKETPEIAIDTDGQPLASAEVFVAVLLKKVDGGETNVLIRGVQSKSFAINGELLKIVEGKNFTAGTDEVIVGQKLVDRIQDCRVGSVITFNHTPLRVVGVFESDSSFGSEIWGDADRVLALLDLDMFNRVVAKLKPEWVPEEKFKEFALRLENHPQIPAKAMKEADYLSEQTGMLSAMLKILGRILGTVMGIAAVFTGTNTMLSAIASRTHEIGVLVSVGFRPFAIFFSFLLEALLLGVIGGLVGCLLILPINGVETGTTNWNTFTEVAFAFRVTPRVLVTSILFAIVLGIVGGAWPAWRAAHMKPTDAMRRA